MIVYLDPDQHGKTGTPLPYWLRFEKAVSTTMERRIKKQMTELLGRGSTTPFWGRKWGHQFMEGWMTLMFASAEDRTLAHLTLNL